MPLHSPTSSLPRLFLALATFATTALATDDARPVEDPRKFKVDVKPPNSLPTIYLVGDSTVRTGTPNQRGWGDELAPFFDSSKVNVVNHAMGGRSSRTFQAEGRWEQTVSQLQPRDFVIIQFGHNDGSPLNDNFRARGTIRGNGDESEEIDNILTGKHETVHSFGWYIRKYITDARAKGATPIVCSLIPRKKWANGKIGRDAASYGGWAREAAAQEKAHFVDLNEIIAQSYEKLGEENVNAFFADPHTHTSVEGAQFNARCVVAGLRGLAGDPLAEFFSAEGNAVEKFRAEP